MKFVCRSCGIPVTSDLEALTDESRLCFDDRADYVPAGFFWKDVDEGFFTAFEGCYFVNLRDAINTRRHRETKRLQGCCGLDGCDGRNIVCTNGHEVGTERSDCWAPYVLALDPTCVELTS